MSRTPHRASVCCPLFILAAGFSLLCAGMITGAQAAGARWPGAQLVFHAFGVAGNNRDLFALDLTRRLTVNLTHTRFTDEFTPAWSPDGAWLAFAANDDGDMDIYTLHMPTGRVEKRTFNTTWDGQPAWSADSQHITYAVASAAGQDLFTLALAAPTAAPQRLTTLNGSETQPHGSPPGTPARLVFRYEFDFESSLYTLALDDVDEAGPRPRLLAPRSTALLGVENPRWSPDGTQIAFAGTPFGAHDLYRVTLATNATTRLTDAPADEGDPAWSPDGAWIAFWRRHGTGQAHLYLVRPDGSGLRALPLDPGDYGAPDWRPVGTIGGQR